MAERLGIDLAALFVLLVTIASFCAVLALCALAELAIGAWREHRETRARERAWRLAAAQRLTVTEITPNEGLR